MSDEYPKVITVDGVTLTVESPEDETRWRQPAAVTTASAEEVTPDAHKATPPVVTDSETLAELDRVDALDDVVPDVLDDPDGAPPADPLDDVSIEMDNPAFQPAKKPKAAPGGAKKK